ncbi:hypothetical protein [Brevundimonas sp.]|uniref:hypothetical protein n=1 Tax=Brevundimonas sp. TaxID=1871086 RepID=UPI0035B01D7B
MPSFSLRRGASLAVLLSAMLLASCETPPEPEPPAPPPPPPPVPAVMLNSGIADAAATYVTFIRDVRTLQPGFQSEMAIQEAMRRGSAWSPEALSRGMIAYGAVIALQSQDFVSGVRTYAADETTRRNVIDQIVRDPAYAAQLPGAAEAAGLVTQTLNQDYVAIAAIGEAMEEDAYTIQERDDPRRSWAVQHIADREGRLEAVRSVSGRPILPSATESARLLAAGNDGTGLGLGTARKGPPYTPAVVRSLAIAALSALGAAGEDWRANHLALTVEQNNEFCLTMSKLNLYQCLAASRPHYEDMFCAGRHVLKDIAVCSSAAIGPGPTPIAIPGVTTAPSPGPAGAPVTTESLNTAPPIAEPVPPEGRPAEPAVPSSNAVPYQPGPN